MIYLAQYHPPGSSPLPHLRLLACQQSPHQWKTLDPLDPRATFPLTQPLPPRTSVNPGDSQTPEPSPGEPDSLMLVDVEGDRVVQWQGAADWVLEMVRNYLEPGLTPQFLQEEAARLEQWRQELTLQTQELSRKQLELEARRAQIQTLEEQT